MAIIVVILDGQVLLGQIVEDIEKQEQGVQTGRGIAAKLRDLAESLEKDSGPVHARSKRPPVAFNTPANY